MTEQQPTEQRYGMLRGLSDLITFLGNVLAIMGSLAVVGGLLIDIGITRIPVVIGGAAAFPIGLLMIASGEGIKVLLDTEASTRRAADATITLIADVRELTTILNRMDYHLQRSANATERLANTVAPPAIKSR
jgi:hypothetical protein